MAQDSNTQNNRNWPPKDPPMFWATFAAFVAVCVYAYFTWQQVQETHTANDIAQKALFFTNRPYIMWVGTDTTPFTESTARRHWRISAEIRNFGKTPAIEVVGKICDPAVTTAPARPRFNCIISEAGNPTTVIGPEQSTKITGPPIDAQTFDDIENGQRLLYIFGDIRYRDKVTKDTVWATRFCHQLVPVQRNATQIQIREITCNDPEWTCIDEACPAQPH